MFITALTALTISACGGGGGGPADTDTPTPKPSSRASAVSGGEAATYILAESELPEGWRYATGEQYLGVPKLCGVTIEPPSLASVETQRYTKNFSGPFVIQYSFVSSDEKATTKRIDEFVAAAGTCTTYKPKKNVTVSVSQITDVQRVGEAFGAVREQDVARASNVQEIVVFRKGAVVTVLQSYSPATLADRAVLSQMAATIAAKQA